MTDEQQVDTQTPEENDAAIKAENFPAIYDLQSFYQELNSSISGFILNLSGFFSAYWLLYKYTTKNKYLFMRSIAGQMLTGYLAARLQYQLSEKGFTAANNFLVLSTSEELDNEETINQIFYSLLTAASCSCLIAAIEYTYKQVTTNIDLTMREAFSKENNERILGHNQMALNSEIDLKTLDAMGHSLYNLNKAIQSNTAPLIKNTTTILTTIGILWRQPIFYHGPFAGLNLLVASIPIVIIRFFIEYTASSKVKDGLIAAQSWLRTIANARRKDLEDFGAIVGANYTDSVVEYHNKGIGEFCKSTSLVKEGYHRKELPYMGLDKLKIGEIPYHLLLLYCRFATRTLTSSGYITCYNALREIVKAITQLASILISAQVASDIEQVSKFLEVEENNSNLPPVNRKVDGQSNALEILALKITDSTGKVLYENCPPLYFPFNTVTALIGHNGTGKSVLARKIAGIFPDGMNTHDTQFIFHKSIKIEEEVLVIDQKPYKAHEKTWYDRILLKVERTKENLQLIDELLKKFFLEEKITQIKTDTKWAEIGASGGEAQIMLLINAILRKPKLLFLDESLSAMDQKATEKAISLIKTHLSKAAVIIVDHDPEKTRSADLFYDQIITFTRNYYDQSAGAIINTFNLLLEALSYIQNINTPTGSPRLGSPRLGSPMHIRSRSSPPITSSQSRTPSPDCALISDNTCTLPPLLPALRISVPELKDAGRGSPKNISSALAKS